jgi:hypothetical protein
VNRYLTRCWKAAPSSPLAAAISLSGSARSNAASYQKHRITAKRIIGKANDSARCALTIPQPGSEIHAPALRWTFFTTPTNSGRSEGQSKANGRLLSEFITIDKRFKERLQLFAIYPCPRPHQNFSHP